MEPILWKTKILKTIWTKNLHQKLKKIKILENQIFFQTMACGCGCRCAIIDHASDHPNHPNESFYTRRCIADLQLLKKIRNVLHLRQGDPAQMAIFRFFLPKVVNNQSGWVLGC